MEMYKNITLALLQHNFTITECSFALFSNLLNNLCSLALQIGLFLLSAFEYMKSVRLFIKIPDWPFLRNAIDMYMFFAIHREGVPCIYGSMSERQTGGSKTAVSKNYT